jgi:hypothetical protein
MLDLIKPSICFLIDTALRAAFTINKSKDQQINQWPVGEIGFEPMKS